LGWLNSDDFYLPGTLAFVAGQLDARQPELLFGNCLHFVDDEQRAYGSDVRSERDKRDLRLADTSFSQAVSGPARRGLKAGILDESLHFGFDWDWFIRAMKGRRSFQGGRQISLRLRIHNELRRRSAR